MRWVPWSTGGCTLAPHHGWSPSILVQVSNILSTGYLNKNGKIQPPHPVDGGYVGGAVVADQMARNPVNWPKLSEENLMVIKFVSVIILQGFDIGPQCLEL